MKIDPGELGEAIARDVEDPDGELGSILREAADVWRDDSRQRVREGGRTYDYNTEPVAQEIQIGDDQWNGLQGFCGELTIPLVFGHEASSYFEHGTEDHVVEPTQATVLKVPWPDAPPGVVEERGDSPYFFGEVEVSGLNALRFVEAGRLGAERYLERQ